MHIFSICYLDKNFIIPQLNFMNRLIILLVVTLFSINLMAQSKADLTISTTGTSNLKIKLNGKRISLSDRSATFENVNPGSYPLVIFQWQRKPNGINEYVEVYNDNITLTGGKHLEVCILRFGKMAWNEGSIYADDWIDGTGNSGAGGNTNNVGAAANEEQFAKIKQAISSSFSDQDKIATAKAVLKNNWLTVVQIRKLTSLFFYDNYKLQFLKDAYNNCTEKGSYFTLADLLFYDSAKRDLMNWIASQ